MAELIDRDALLESLEIKDMPKTAYETGYCDSRTIAIYKIIKMPTVDAEPIRHGRWLYSDTIGGMRYYRCTNCADGRDCIADENEIMWYAYCPNCGARMDGDENG